MHASKYCYLKHYIKAKHIGRYFYFEDKFSNKDASIAFGLAGSAMSYKVRGFVLDTSNGEVSLLTETMLYLMTKEHKDILQEYKKTKRKRKNREHAIIALNKRYMQSEK